MSGILRFVGWSLRGQRERLAALSLGLVSISICVTLLAGVTQLSTLTLDQHLSHSWRAAYDLLVRPPDALSDIERGLHVVDPASPEQTYGGITLAQVATIARLPHIAVAAPEAVVGWVPLQPYQPVTFTAPGLYRVTTRLSQGNETEQTQTIYDVLPLAAFGGGSVTPLGEGFVTVPLDASGTATIAASWPISSLLVGVDPAAESQLVGLRWQPAATQPASGAALPLLVDTHPWAALTATLLVEQAQPVLGRDDASAAIPDDPVAALAHWATRSQGHLDAHDLLSLLARELAGQGEHPEIAPLQGGGATRLARASYSLLGAPDGTTGNTPLLGVQSAGTDASGPLLRLPLLPQATTPWVSLGARASETPGAGIGAASASPVATFDAAQMQLPYDNDTDTLSAPMGLYRPAPDGAMSGALPGIFPQHALVSWPPLLFTTVGAACALTGVQCISAVRVRVGGLGGFGPRSEALLREVAAEIEAHTGLHVDVLAGASGFPVRVQPDTAHSPQAATPLRLIWVQPHTAVTIASGVNAANIALLLAVVVVAVLAMVAAALLAAASRRADLRLLTETGWSPGSLLTAVALESGLAAALMGMLAWLCALALDHLGAPAVAPLAVIASLAAAVLLYLACSCLVAWHGLTRPRPPLHRPRWVWRSAPWWWALLWRQLSGRWGTSALVAGSVAGACGLVALLALIHWGLDGILYSTLLGQQVQVALSGVHVIAALLACGCAVLTAALTLLLAVRERSGENALLLAVGWTSRAVAGAVVREGATLGALGGLSGGGAAVLVFLLLYHTPTPLLGVGVVGTGALGGLLGALGAGYPARVAMSISPARSLADD